MLSREMLFLWPHASHFHVYLLSSNPDWLFRYALQRSQYQSTSGKRSFARPSLRMTSAISSAAGGGPSAATTARPIHVVSRRVRRTPDIAVAGGRPTSP